MNQRFEALIVATHNPAKARRYREVMAEYCSRVVDLRDVAVTERPDERGETAEENAEIKAKFYVRQTGCAVLSEDEALFVDFLPDESQPGVHVRRINGRTEANDEDLLAHWEKVIASVPVDKRTGRWHIAYCFALPDGTAKTFSLDFPIRFFSHASPVRVLGWPMSSLQGPLNSDKPHSELTEGGELQANRAMDLAFAKAIEEITW